MEIGELRAEVFNAKLDDWDIAFEATDVIIYLLHIASELNIDISEAIKNIDKSDLTKKPDATYSNNE